MGEQEKEFVRGVAYTVAQLRRGVPEHELLREAGLTMDDIKEAGVPDEDIEAIATTITAPAS